MFLEQFDIIGIGTDLIKPSSFVWRPMAFILIVNVSEKCGKLNGIMVGKPENRKTGKNTRNLYFDSNDVPNREGNKCNIISSKYFSHSHT
jgi:hypothetical protein